jgi:hypothetical protein
MVTVRSKSGESPVLIRPVRVSSFDRVFSSLLIVRKESTQRKGCKETFFPYNIGMETKRMGRPPKPAEERQTARLEIRMTAADLKLIEGAADGNTSTWARNVLVRAAKRAK